MNIVLDGTGQYTKLLSVVKANIQTPQKTIIADFPLGLLHCVEFV